MISLKTKYDLLAIEGLQKPLQEISKTCRGLGIDFFIVGAIARNIWLAANDEKASGTKDIDFGVYVPNKEIYINLRSALIENYGYTLVESNAFCLIDSDGRQIDLLPFGEIEEYGEVTLEGKGLNLVRLDGFKEAFVAGSIDVEIGEDQYRSCSIPGVVLLKMIAFDDRPERRIKDIIDINSICLVYPLIESNHIWEEHSDLYGNEELEHFDVGMIVLGREIAKLIASNKELNLRVRSIIEKAISGESTFLTNMIENAEEETITQKRSILQNIHRGLTTELQ